MDVGQKNGKYLKIYREIKEKLLSGGFQEGDKLPTETEYSEQYAVSRPTVTKALNALADEGFITRKTGSGSYVRNQTGETKSRLLGLLIPGLGRGEIFEPISAQIAWEAEKNNYSLLWSGFDKTDKMHPLSSTAIARRYIDNRAAGIFFQPLELWYEAEEVNRQVVRVFQSSSVPVVLIDSDYTPYPQRSAYDLVGLDNFQAGYTAALHFLKKGLQRLDFLFRPYSAESVGLRIRGYVSALFDGGVHPDPRWIHGGYPEDPRFVKKMIQEEGARDIICANDETASVLLQTLEREGISVPEDVRIMGFDDVKYAQHLKVPLSTIRQPCDVLGHLAMELMLWRIDHPTAPPRTVTVPGTLVVRASSEAPEKGHP